MTRQQYLPRMRMLSDHRQGERRQSLKKRKKPSPAESEGVGAKLRQNLLQTLLLIRLRQKSKQLRARCSRHKMKIAALGSIHLKHIRENLPLERARMQMNPHLSQRALLQPLQIRAMTANVQPRNRQSEDVLKVPKVRHRTREDRKSLRTQQSHQTLPRTITLPEKTKNRLREGFHQVRAALLRSRLLSSVRPHLK